MNIYESIERLIHFSVLHGLIEKYDEVFVRNSLFDLLKVEPKYMQFDIDEKLETATVILDDIAKYAVERGIVEEGIVEYDLFVTRVMGVVTPMPSVVIKEFNRLYDIDKKMATDYFYDLCRRNNYIMVDRTSKNIEWDKDTDYGKLKITINVSKPEKNSKDIEKEKTMKKLEYPKCLLCKENEGFAGTFNHPARQNIRIIPLTLNKTNWFVQYSPYAYYHEHCIVLNSEHIPMTIDEHTCGKLLDFIDLLPHYFVGSNSELPIVGGSILAHEHFQGGGAVLPMANATVKYEFESNIGVTAQILKWPMSVIRLKGTDKKQLEETAKNILSKWRTYDSEQHNIVSHTGDTVHNTITPIARYTDMYELDLVLRNNRTSEEYPDGIFHPHKNLHNIKKENIGLIEVMGLGVLPARLVKELEEVKKCLVSSYKLSEDSVHYDWCNELVNKYGTDNNEDGANKIVKDEVGGKFLQCLIDAGIFKDNAEADKDFIEFVTGCGFLEK